MLAPSYDGLHCPYAVRVLANTAVARKVAHVQTIDDRLVAPFVFRGVQGIHLVLCQGVRRKVREHQEGLTVAQQAVDHRFGVVRTPRREESRFDEIQSPLEFRTGFELALRPVARAPCRNLFRGETEY